MMTLRYLLALFSLGMISSCVHEAHVRPVTYAGGNSTPFTFASEPTPIDSVNRSTSETTHAIDADSSVLILPSLAGNEKQLLKEQNVERLVPVQRLVKHLPSKEDEPADERPFDWKMFFWGILISLIFPFLFPLFVSMGMLMNDNWKFWGSLLIFLGTLTLWIIAIVFLIAGNPAWLLCYLIAVAFGIIAAAIIAKF